ncbi:Peptidoglycan-binding protein, CsiV [Marinobacter antarcticus]|uniref:Peptidoglycan-binding protein, CsiV n=1 Tax=Marinobacter antarcticus TaxID=564117 RepID=A0A1M6S502_9GAMM|nr:CsiV family protein [Marinobacter antarcticus]SHK39749.1 Peptidoglycan-binding protein, CsiV [Marinobacter antarcticus]
MQTDGNRLCRLLARTLLTAFLLTTAMGIHAQQTPDDYYRAEFVILERIVEPGEVNERMVNRKVEAPVDTSETLYRVARDGTTSSSLKLVPRNELHLGSAANRLERSGRYRVLMSAGWYEAFPPDYKGQPLRIEIGDWLEQAGQREIEGNITIDRQRYLHVAVHLNHWQEGKIAAPGVTLVNADQTPGASPAASAELAIKPDIPLELVTWIRETRRMRSEEIHFLDSPTIGVLIFFKKVEAKP